MGDLLHVTRDQSMAIVAHRRDAGHRSFVMCLLSLVTCLLFLPGCVTRSLTIKSEPPGALVYMDDQLKGQSPLSYDFLWYGWHRVTLRKAGYERLDDHKLLRSPVYLWIPFDLVMELAPFRVRDTRTWAYALTPSPAMPTPVPPEIEPNTTSPPSTQPEAASQVNGLTPPDTAVGAMIPTVAPPTSSESGSVTQPPTEPNATEPTTEPTHGTR